MATATLCSAFGKLSVSARRPQQQVAAARLSFCRNGIAATQRLTAARVQPLQAQREAASVIVCGKLKTRKAAAKRFKITGSGKVVRRKPGKQHINEKMRPSHLKRLGQSVVVNDSDIDNIISCLPYAGIKQRNNKH